MLTLRAQVKVGHCCYVFKNWSLVEVIYICLIHSVVIRFCLLMHFL